MPASVGQRRSRLPDLVWPPHQATDNHYQRTNTDNVQTDSRLNDSKGIACQRRGSLPYVGDIYQSN